jgi:peptide/nickel transport system substrate-binding protein
MVFAACAAPAAAPTTGAADAPAAEAPASDLPAEPGRGTDGPLKLVYWQEVSILNPYLSTGTKDYHAASLILESLIEVMPDGTLIPALAQEVPTLENGGISEDLTTITYQLKPDVVWSDGTPLTADDVIFTWQFCVDPDTGCSSAIAFTGVQNVEAVDPQTVKITFDGPTPYPYNPFGGYLAPVLQKAQFEGCIGAAAQGCSEQNTAPIGTGPYKVKEFRANDTVVYDINENYRDPNKPHFSEVTFSGAEDASASARAVLETGEADYGWNRQCRAHPDQLHQPGRQPGRSALGLERRRPEPASVPERPRRAPGALDGDRPHDHCRAALRRWRRADLQRPLRPAGGRLHQ